MGKSKVYEDIRGRIIAGAIEPGQRLVEKKLCGDYGLSRTPIREVLFQLVSDGLLERAPSRGFYVRTLTLEQIVEIFQAREGVEGIASRLACQRLTSAHVERLTYLQKEITEVDVEVDRQAGVALGRSLHNFIHTTANNSVVSEFYVKLNNLTFLTANLAVRAPTIEVQSRLQHLAIIDALLSKDPDLAERRMREHLRGTCGALTRTYFGEVMGIIGEDIL